MFSDCFWIRLEADYNIIERRPLVIRDVEQYLNTMMIGHSLEVPFNLLCGFLFPHTYTYMIYDTQYPNILKFVGVLSFVRSARILPEKSGGTGLPGAKPISGKRRGIRLYHLKLGKFGQF